MATDTFEGVIVTATPMTPERGGSGGFESTMGGVWDFYPNPRDGWDE